MRYPIAALFLPALFTLTQAVTAQVTYYVSNSGNDSNAGTNAGAPWQTLAKVTAIDAGPGFGPGDKILLEKGGVWNEASTLTLNSTGSASSPGKITLGSYGTTAAPPRISGFQRGLTHVCVKITNSYWRVENIQFEHAYRGLNFYGGNFGVTDVEVVNCYFKNIENRTNPLNNSAGILFDWNGWTNPVVRSCTFEKCSLGVQVATGNDCINIVVDDCEMFGGWGAGVALQNVSGGTITRTRIRDTGDSNPVGTTGLFLVSCDGVVIDGCSVSGTRHMGGFDGCGVDFESDNSNCQLRNSFIYDNEGPAILMFSGGGVANTNITIADCLLYNNNRILHSPGTPSTDPADAVIHFAVPGGGSASTGTISNCGIYKTANSSGNYGGNSTGFTITGVLATTYNDGWIPVYGKFDDLSVGGNGHIVAVARNNVPYRWNGNFTGNCWSAVGGLTTAAQASIGEDGELWAVDTSNAVWRYAGSSTWSLGSHLAMAKISVGSAANIWGLGLTGTPYLRTSGSFAAITSSPLADLDAGPVYGDAWGLNGTSPVRYNISGPSWVSVSGTLTQVSCHGSYTNGVGTFHIAAGVNGTTPMRTVNATPNWITLPGSLAQIAEGSDGVIWGRDSNGYIWRRF